MSTKGGKLSPKWTFFEKPGQRPISSPGPEWMTNNSLKPNNDSASFFSWSKRLNPEDQNTSSAEKHNQFRKYYGYHPGEITTQPLKPKYFLEQQIQESPASLPLFLENLPPPPPIRTNTLNKESKTRYNEGEVNIHYKTPVRQEAKEYIPEDELRRRQEDQMRTFYQNIEHKKEQELIQDMQNRKHHDTLLPTQKSPIPLNRYEDMESSVSGQNITPQSTLNRSTTNYKMVSKALYNFQAQNHRELSFKKGDLVYIRRQVDDNWYEGERNAMIGIFPVTYVEIIPNESVGSLSRNNRTKEPATSAEGKGKAKFNFQAQTPMELSLIKGEMVTLTRRVDQNWYEGRIGSRKGIFPATYVEILVEPGEPRGMSPSPIIKPVASPASHSILKNGSLPVPSYNPNYSVQSPYSTINSRPGSSMSQSCSIVQQSSSLHMESKNEPIPFRALYNYKPQNDDEVELSEGDVVYVMEKCDDGWFVGTSQRTGIFGTFPGNYVAKA